MKNKGARPSMALPVPPSARAGSPLLWGYGFGAGLIGAGLLVLSVALGSALRSATRGIHKISLPAAQLLTLKEGVYVAMLPNDKKGPPPSAEGVRVTLEEEGGAPLTQVPFPPELARANGKAGLTLFQVEVPEDGRYVLRGETPGEAPVDLLLVHESLSRNPSDILVGVILMSVLGGFGVYIIIMTSLRGRRPAPAK